MFYSVKNTYQLNLFFNTIKNLDIFIKNFNFRIFIKISQNSVVFNNSSTDWTLFGDFENLHKAIITNTMMTTIVKRYFLIFPHYILRSSYDSPFCNIYL